MGSAVGPRKCAISEINVTPLVDVMLVLLVIFMLTAPMMNQSLDLNLPKVNTVASSTESKGVTVSIRASGSLFVDKQPLGKKSPLKSTGGNHQSAERRTDLPGGRQTR